MTALRRRRDPDADYDAREQRAIDERAEICAACEPWFDDSAFRPTPDELAAQDAYMEGQRAGHLNKHPGENPWQSGCPEHAAWELGRMAVVGV